MKVSRTDGHRSPDVPAPASGAIKVSVVIPTYNHRDHVLTALESVFAQTYTDYEVVVVNDGSPDDTEAVLRPLVEAGRIRYHPQPNAGQAAARNRGLQLAIGEYVAFLDDDDVWPPDKLEWQVATLDAHPPAVLAYGSEDRLLSDGSRAPAPPELHPDGDVYAAFLTGYCITSPGQTLIRADALRVIGGFDESLWGVDDWDLYLRLARLGDFRYVDRPALHYRIHAGNASGNAIRHVHSAWRLMWKHSWNPALQLRQIRRSADYYAPNLLQFAQAAGERGDYVSGARAYLYAAVYRPALLHPRRLREVAKRFVRALRRRRTAPLD